MISAGISRGVAWPFAGPVVWIVISLMALFVLNGCRSTVHPGDPDADADAEWDMFDGNLYRPPGDLVIEPSPIVFEVEEIGLESFQDVTFSNEGPGELVVFQLDPEGMDWAQIEIVEADLPIGLSPGESTQVVLAYTPDSCDAMEARLKVAWSSEEEPRMEVGMLAVGLSAEMSVEPEFIAYGRVGADTSVSRMMTVSNSGRCPLYIDQLAIDGSPSFYLSRADTGREGVPFIPDFPIEVTRDEPLLFNVTFDAPADIPEDATLVIGDSTTGETVEVPLSANRRECPVAVAGATILEDPGELVTEIDAIPLQTIQFDARESYDPDRVIVAYEWTVVERPEDSTAQLVPNSNISNPSFFLDLAGDYVFELVVYDDDGLVSCNTDQVSVHVVPDEDIHVQLVWHTPGDPNQLDFDGTDLDLHVLRQPGRWDESVWDCNWHNMNPDWAESGNPDDDPSLDIDDVDGSGPENINLNEPERGTTYAIGVYYYSDRGMGESYATVRVFIDGILVYEAQDKELDRTGFFWDVGRISWPSNEVEVVDAVYQFGFP